MMRVYAATAGLSCLFIGTFASHDVRAAEEQPAAVIALSSSCLIGGTTGGRWLKANDMAGLLQGGERYRLYGLKGLLGEATGAKPDPVPPEEEPCRDTRVVAVSPSPNKDATLAIGGQWNALPRPVQVLSNSIGTYREALGRVLTQNGISSSGAAPSQTLRVDLDGDGKLEVLIAASKHTGSLGTSAKAGDYSVVLLQKISKGGVLSIPVVSQYHRSEKEAAVVEQYQIVGVLDVDGDGKMEIAVHGSYHEGDWTTLYSIVGDKAQEVVTCGCSV